MINKKSQFYPVTAVGGNWENLAAAPPEVKEAISQHLSDLQNGGRSYVGKATHYLNPYVRRTEHAKRTWAREWRSWPSIGVGTTVHYFGSPDPVSIPDYVPMYEPTPPIPTPRPPYPKPSVADQYAYMGLTRRLAPANPVDREFHTNLSEHLRLARDLSSQGLLGLDGRTANMPVPGRLDPMDTRSIRGQRAGGSATVPGSSESVAAYARMLQSILGGLGSARPSPSPQSGRAAANGGAMDTVAVTRMIRQMQQAGASADEVRQMIAEARLRASATRDVRR